MIFKSYWPDKNIRQINQSFYFEVKGKGSCQIIMVQHIAALCSLTHMPFISLFWKITKIRPGQGLWNVPEVWPWVSDTYLKFGRGFVTRTWSLAVGALISILNSSVTHFIRSFSVYPEKYSRPQVHTLSITNNFLATYTQEAANTVGKMLANLWQVVVRSNMYLAIDLV